MYKKGNKIIASIIVFIMLIANMSTIGIHVGEVIATNSDLNTQDSKTNNSNVEFDSYFIDGENKTYDSTKKIGEENKIVAQISVKNAGYLKDARIEFIDSNFKILDEVNSEKVSNIENNIITLNQIDNGESIEIDLPFIFEHNTKINIAEFDKISEVSLTGVYVDENGKERDIQKEINLGLKWTADAQLTLTGEIAKYVPYDINGQKGLIMQMLVKENVKDNVLPIKENNIEISVPEINGIEPTNVTVYNQDNNIQSIYDEAHNKLMITAQNSLNEQNEIYWSDKVEDKYIVTYTYSEEALNSISEDGVNVDIVLNSTTKVYSYNEQELTASYEQTVTLKDKIGEIVDFTIVANENLSKGYMYANEIAQQKTETTYTEKVTANISLPELVDKITIDMNTDKFVNDEASEQANSYYKNIKIAKSEFDKFLGEEGFIKIYSGDTLINTIDNSIEEENIVINLNADEITIVTSKPIIAGELVFEFEKAIRGESTYTKAKLESFKNLQLQAIAKVKGSETQIVEKQVNTQIALVEPILETELLVSDTNLSTVVTNENVELRAVLKTNSEYNKLFENPTIVIDLPEYIESINIKNVQPLFDDELKLESYNVIENQIIIELTGVQTKYSVGSVYGGTNIVITADITVNNLTPNKEAQIKMTTMTAKEQVESIVNVNFVAPTGIVTVNKISNYVEGQTLMALTSDEEATLEVQTVAKNATAEIQVINNYNNVINNIQILGRTLATGTADIDSENELNNTFDAPMIGAINTNGLENVSIYYTENGNATQDLENAENGWTTEIADFSKVKSYLIVLNDYTMNVGDTIKFTYDVQIPENLGYSETVNSVYTVYFDNIQEEQVIQDRAKARMLTLATGVAPELEVNLSSYSEENSIVREGQYVRFIATVKNIGTVDAENVKLNVTAPNGNIYNYVDENGDVVFTTSTENIENVDEQLAATFTTRHTEFVEDNYTSDYIDSEDTEKTILIGNLKAGESKEIQYELKIESIQINEPNLYTQVPESETQEAELIYPEIIINNQARAIADDMQKEVTSNEYKLKAEDGVMAVTIKANKTSDYVLTKGAELTYSAKVVQNDIHGDTNNVVVTVNIPEGLKIKDANIENLVISDRELVTNVNIDRENNIVKFTIKEFPQAYEISCNVITEVEDVLGTISPRVTVTADGEDTYYGNITFNKVSKLSFEIKQSNLDNPYVKEKEQITYEYVIENTSDVYSDDLKFENKIPEGMKFVSAEVIVGDLSQKIIDTVEDTLIINRTSFEPGQKIIIKITMEAELLPTGETEKEITNFATIYGTGFDTVQSNSVKTIIEYSKEAHINQNPDIDSDPDNTDVRNKISGIAWIDTNQDGERNDDEPILSGVQVRLLNSNTNEIVKDIDSGNEKITTTSSSGEYIFTNLEDGEYLVVFVYNSAKYDLTQYKKTGVSQSTNSDVINVNMQIDGKETKVAVSDIIKLAGSNVRNIDIGLCESEKSDLRLDKYIRQITLTYGNTVKTYEYEDVKLAKVEIPAKELSNATVIVEYKIAVTNEGAIGNYVKKIVDYIPKDMKFNSELNRDWYQSSNGDIYNSSLANTKLESGETLEVTLTLTKKMTDDNVGIVNNNAEIYEVYNEEGILDIDSTPANKASGEDDMSAADVVISVKTGDAIMYTAIISTIICIAIGVSIYYIRKYVLRRM